MGFELLIQQITPSAIPSKSSSVCPQGRIRFDSDGIEGSWRIHIRGKMYYGSREDQ